MAPRKDGQQLKQAHEHINTQHMVKVTKVLGAEQVEQHWAKNHIGSFVRKTVRGYTSQAYCTLSIGDRGKDQPPDINSETRLSGRLTDQRRKIQQP